VSLLCDVWPIIAVVAFFAGVGFALVFA